MNGGYGPCCCTLVVDTFNRVGATAADNVNHPGGNRYRDFDPEQWSIVTSGAGGALRSHGGGPIYFFERPANVIVFALLTDGQFARLSSGLHYIEITATLVDFGGGDTRLKFTYDFDGVTWTEPDDTLPPGTGSGRAATLQLAFAPRPLPGTTSDDPENPSYVRLFHSLVPMPTQDLLRGGMCQYVDVNMRAQIWNWSLSGSDGVTFDSLEVDRPAAECEPMDIGCQHICHPLAPTSLTVTISGMGATEGWCDSAAREAAFGVCFDAYEAAVLAALGDCALICAAEVAYRDCQCAANEAHVTKVPACPDLNGVWVLDAAVDQINKCVGPCNYVGTQTFEVYDGEEDCGSRKEIEVSVSAQLEIDYYDAETETLFVRVTVSPALDRISDNEPLVYEATGVEATALCDQEEIDLEPAGVAAYYADEVRVTFVNVADGLTGSCHHDGQSLGPDCSPANPNCSDGGGTTDCFPGDPEHGEQNAPSLANPGHDPILVTPLEAQVP